MYMYNRVIVCVFYDRVSKRTFCLFVVERLQYRFRVRVSIISRLAAIVERGRNARSRGDGVVACDSIVTIILKLEVRTIGKLTIEIDGAGAVRIDFFDH